MNERYLFRGKRKYNGDWLQGDFAHRNGNVYVFPTEALNSTDWYEVDPTTFGQCTGLLDKNGTLIFDGGIVEIVMPLKDTKPIIARSEVFWCEASWRVHWSSDLPDRVGTRIDSFSNDVTFEIIGNIHENPELLKED